uniref:Uncharacterized protein n=1 Tax=Oryza glumipatula TaxID=40148 RepID=A0A0D9Z5W0_9ORYZ
MTPTSPLPPSSRAAPHLPTTTTPAIIPQRRRRRNGPCGVRARASASAPTSPRGRALRSPAVRACASIACVARLRS